MTCPSQEKLDGIFPPGRTDAFFEALYGGAEEGAYDIRLICRSVTDTTAHMAFDLVRRPGQCLRCNLTYGLPQVFSRHPVIGMDNVAKKIAALLGWTQGASWELGKTEEASEDHHSIPLTISRKP